MRYVGGRHVQWRYTQERRWHTCSMVDLAAGVSVAAVAGGVGPSVCRSKACGDDFGCANKEWLERNEFDLVKHILGF